MTRWLTEDEKESALSYWHRTRDVQPDNVIIKREFVAGGYGWPDPPMFPYCDRLNALDGVCTVSSCTGHVYQGTKRYSDGHVWLRLSEKASTLIDQNMGLLVSLPTVTKLARNYFLAETHVPWEYLEIEFQGNAEALEANLMPIVGFFEWLLTNA